MNKKKIKVLATGGTIAGRLNHAGADQYQSAQFDIANLLAPLAHSDVYRQWLENYDVDYQQICQIDSKDVDYAFWHLLWEFLQTTLNDDSVAGIVVTHGTDTMEESTFLMDCLLTTTKPIVFTGAMRAFDDPKSDGLDNLQDALWLASQSQIAQYGVTLCFAGQLIASRGLRKIHTTAMDAFSGTVLAQKNHFESDRTLNSWNFFELSYLATAKLLQPYLKNLITLPINESQWPQVPMLLSYPGQCFPDHENPTYGLVVKSFGNGSLNANMMNYIQKQMAQDVLVVLASRVPHGQITYHGHELIQSGLLSSYQARVLLLVCGIAKLKEHDVLAIFQQVVH